jgi:hypothetical protein
VAAAEQILNVELPETLNSVRVASHLGVAASNLLRKRDLGKAVEHCGLAIKADSKCVAAYLRRSEARVELGDFDGGLDDLHKCIRLTGGGRKKKGGRGAELARKDIEGRIRKAEFAKRMFRGECSWA